VMVATARPISSAFARIAGPTAAIADAPQMLVPAAISNVNASSSFRIYLQNSTLRKKIKKRLIKIMESPITPTCSQTPTFIVNPSNAIEPRSSREAENSMPALQLPSNKEGFTLTTTIEKRKDHNNALNFKQVPFSNNHVTNDKPAIINVTKRPGVKAVKLLHLFVFNCIS